MKVIVLGTGAIGAYYGAQLARAGHAVTCFARGANLGAIQERGLEVRTPEGGFRAPVTATDRAEQLAPADFAILAVKSYSLVDIAPIVRRCAEQETTVVPLLNGVETVQRLEQLGVPPAAVIGGLTVISAVRIAPGVVERRSPFQIVVVGEPDGRTSDRVDRIASAFRNALAIRSTRSLVRDRKSTRLNSSHVSISYAVFCLKKKNKEKLNTKTNPTPLPRALPPRFSSMSYGTHCMSDYSPLCYLCAARFRPVYKPLQVLGLL